MDFYDIMLSQRLSGGGGGGSSYTLLGSVEVDLSNVGTSSTLLHTFENLPGAWDASKIIYMCARNKAGKIADAWFGNDVFAINSQIQSGGTSLTGTDIKGFLYKMNYSAKYVMVNDGSSYGVFPSIKQNAVEIKGRASSTSTGTMSGTAIVDIYAIDFDFADGKSPFIA